jgi:hypothetical protein
LHCRLDDDDGDGGHRNGVVTPLSPPEPLEFMSLGNGEEGTEPSGRTSGDCMGEVEVGGGPAGFAMLAVDGKPVVTVAGKGGLEVPGPALCGCAAGFSVGVDVGVEADADVDAGTVAVADVAADVGVDGGAVAELEESPTPEDVAAGVGVVVRALTVTEAVDA